MLPQADEFEAANPALTVVRAQAPAEIVVAATEACGRIDVVVCNDAGAAVRAPIERASPEDLRSALEEMVVFPFEMASAVVPQMKAQKRGKILFITSATPLRGLPNYSMYVTARGATNALTVSLAQAARPRQHPGQRDRAQLRGEPDLFPARAGQPTPKPWPR